MIALRIDGKSTIILMNAIYCVLSQKDFSLFYETKE